MSTTSTRPLYHRSGTGPPPVSMTFLFRPEWVMTDTVPATAALPACQAFTRFVVAFALHLQE